MRISQAQLDAIARNALLDKLERGFRASVPDADLLEAQPLRDFLVACEHDAQALGLSSEQALRPTRWQPASSDPVSSIAAATCASCWSAPIPRCARSTR